MATTWTFSLRAGVPASAAERDVWVNGSPFDIDRALSVGGGSFVVTEPTIAARLIELTTFGGKLLDVSVGSIANPTPAVSGDPVVASPAGVLGTNASGTFVPLSAQSGSDGPQGPPGLVWRGTYNNGTTYATNDFVNYNGAAFIATAGTTGVNPGSSGSPNAPWQLLVVGPTGPAGSGAAGVITPADVGAKAWTQDPESVVVGTRATLVNGEVWGHLLKLPDSGTVSSLSFFVGVAGTSITATAVGLVDMAGNRLSQDTTATLFSTTGLKVATFTPVTCTGQLVYAAFMCAFSGTNPQVTKSSNPDTGMLNIGTVRRSCRIGVGTGSIPTSTDMSGNQSNNNAIWAAVI